MATYVKGDAVANATGYELLEKTAEGVYNSLAEASEINFELDSLGLAAGDHTLVVKAKADGYEDSDYSNEVVYTVEGDTVVWMDLPVTTYSLGVTSTGTGRVSDGATRFSTADPENANGILIPAGQTIYFKGLASGTYPLRFDYLYGTSAGPNPAAGSTTAIEGLVGTASNYVSDDYFPMNTEGNDECSVTNTYGADYYFFFGFAGLTKAEKIQAEFDTYDIKYYIA